MSTYKKKIRQSFRKAVLERDQFTCRGCGQVLPAEELDAHHITDRNEMPNGGYVIENGISLCKGETGCHMKAERFHISEGTTWVEGFHPNDLYRLIGSSKEKAIAASEKL